MTAPGPFEREPEAPTRGAFIVIEGLDRAGKSTQVERLAQRWTTETHFGAEKVRFPGKPWLENGRLVRTALAFSIALSSPYIRPHHRNWPETQLLFDTNRGIEASTARGRAPPVLCEPLGGGVTAAGQAERGEDLDC